MLSNILIDYFIDDNDNVYILKRKEFSVKKHNIFVNNNY